MGNCFVKSEKLTAEIIPRDVAKVYPTVRLYGSPKSILTTYIRFALLHKSVSLDFVPSSETLRDHFGSDPDGHVTLQVGSESVTGSREKVLRFMEARFPNLVTAAGGVGVEEGKLPVMVTLTRLQHKSMLWHVERVLRWAEDLVKRGGKKAVDPSVGSPKMEIRKFARSYSELLEVMMEHARMEETLLFPFFDRADRGLSKAAKEEHARDLPLMNGIKEIIKSVGVLDSGSPDFQEALYNLSARLKLLLGQCKQHFKEEEVDLLPLMEALELSKDQEETALDQCFDLMHGTHGRLLKFFLEGLQPRDSMKYLDLISMCSNQDKMESMLQMIVM